MIHHGLGERVDTVDQVLERVLYAGANIVAHAIIMVLLIYETTHAHRLSL